MMNQYFGEINKNFGFGCMRLPMKDGNVDNAEFGRMIEAYFAAGFNYFDTAHGYLNGKSEIALRECLTSKYPREKYILTDKLTNFFFKKEEDVRPFFEKQLEILGVDYLDFYLMHAQGKGNFEYFKNAELMNRLLSLRKKERSVMSAFLSMIPQMFLSRS